MAESETIGKALSSSVPKKRKYRSEKEKLELINGKGSSGLTVAAYCQSIGIHQTQYYAWKRKLRDMALGESSATLNSGLKKKCPDFVEISPNAIQPTGYLELSFHGALSVKIPESFNPAALESVLRCVKSQGFLC